MRAHPFRFVSICREIGIISDTLFNDLVKSVGPKQHHDKSLLKILKSDLSVQAFKELALYELPNPFKKSTEEDEADSFISQTVHLQGPELIHILQQCRPELDRLAQILKDHDPALAERFAKLPRAADDPHRKKAYAALVERKIINPHVLRRLVRNQNHPFFERNRFNLARRVFSLNGILAEGEFDKTLAEAIKEGDFFSKRLEARGVLNEQRLKKLLGEPLELPTIKFQTEDLDRELAVSFPEVSVRRNLFLAFAKDESGISIAVTDPLNLNLADTLSLLTCRPAFTFYAPQGELVEAINRVYPETKDGAAGGPGRLAASIAGAVGADHLENDMKVEVQEIDTVVDTMSTVQLVTMIMESALEANATDIHLESFAERLRVRYRIDGVLHRAMDIPKEMMLPTLSRVKVLANMDVTERRRPQDGHFALTLEEEKYDFRVSSLPTNLGEKIVIRALKEQSLAAGLEELGLEKKQHSVLVGLITRNYGCILTTGPTGSGKTTTLYTALSMLNSEERNIVTIEDPVEYQLEGVTQVPVDLKVELTFANGLRSVLRQDPDVIMVGEIRDRETAQVAIRAALTGHLVLTTMHTNTSASAIVTLMNMGVPHFLISSAVIGIVAQRLLRTICPDCRRGVRSTKAMLRDLKLEPNAKLKMFRGCGCAACWETGYLGRTGIYEILKVDDNIRRLIVRDASEEKLFQQAVTDGMQSLQQSALNKVRVGLTSPEEALKHAFMNE